MGYNAQPFAVSLDQIRGVLGSNDLKLLEKVKSAKLYRTYARQFKEEVFDEALKDLIVNYIPPANRTPASGWQKLFKSTAENGLRSKFAHLYGYGLLVLCETLGTDLSPGGDYFHVGEFWEEINSIFKEQGISPDLDRMTKREKLFDIPPIHDFPVISHYSMDEINHLLSELRKVDIDDHKADPNGDDFDDLHELLKLFRDGLQVCKDKNVEWVAFLH